VNDLPDDLEMTSGRCCEKSVPSVSIGEGEIGATREEEVKERNVSRPTRDQERCETMGVSTVDVGPNREEVRDGFEVPKAARLRQKSIELR